MKSLIIGIMVEVSALLPSKAPAPGPRRDLCLVGEQPYRDLRLQAFFLGAARLTKAVGFVGLEVQGRYVEQDQRGSSDAGVPGQQTRQVPGEALGGVAWQTTLECRVGHRRPASVRPDS